MKAVLALVFFACVAGSMASTPAQLAGQIVQQGQAVAQAVLGQLQQQIQQLLQQAIGSISALVGSIGGRGDLSTLFDQITALLNGQINQVLGQVLAGLSGLIGGMSLFLPPFAFTISPSSSCRSCFSRHWRHLERIPR